MRRSTTRWVPRFRTNEEMRRLLKSLWQLQAEKEEAGKTYEDLLMLHAGVISEEEMEALSRCSESTKSEPSPMNFEA